MTKRLLYILLTLIGTLLISSNVFPDEPVPVPTAVDGSVITGSIPGINTPDFPDDESFLTDNGSTKTSGNVPYLQDFDNLRNIAIQNGNVEVIVGFNTDSRRTSPYAEVSDSVRTAEIKSAQSSLLATLNSGDFTTIREFDFVPFIALKVNVNALDQLSRSLLVASIHENKASEPALDDSTLQIGAAGTGGVWDMGYTGWEHTVAVLDTGVNKTHTYLSGQVISEACYSTTDSSTDKTSACPGGVASSTATGSGVNCDSSYYGCDHGTHVAGIVASTNTTYTGVAPDAKLISIQVFSLVDDTVACKGRAKCVLATDADIIAGLERVYALRNTYKIASINMSIGGGRYTSNCDTQPIKTTIDLLRNANIPTVISAGNDAYTDAVGYPACVSTAITVGGVDKSDVVYNNGNLSSLVDVLAPGVSIVSSVPGSTSIASKTGTSMAAPHVAGAWALMKQGKPNATVNEVEGFLENEGLSVSDTRTGGTITRTRIQVNDSLVAMLGQASSGYRWNQNTTNYPIEDYITSNDNWTYVPITISGAPAGAVVTQVIISYRILHTYPGDLDVALGSPASSNQWKNIWAELGGTDDGGFDDDPESDEDIYINRRYENYFYDGDPVNGTWHLAVLDNASGDTGYVDWVDLIVYYYAPPAQATSTATATATATATPTQIPAVNAITNGGFEGSAVDGIPYGWIGRYQNLEAKDYQVCNTGSARSGSCAYMFQGTPIWIRTKLNQKIENVSPFPHGSKVTFGFYVNKLDSAPGHPFAKFIIQYGDGYKDKYVLRIPNSTGYTWMSQTVTINSAGRGLDFVKISFRNRLYTGKFLLDDVSLMVTQPSGLREKDLMPLPDKPDTFRD